MLPRTTPRGNQSRGDETAVSSSAGRSRVEDLGAPPVPPPDEPELAPPAPPDEEVALPAAPVILPPGQGVPAAIDAGSE